MKKYLLLFTPSYYTPSDKSRGVNSFKYFFFILLIFLSLSLCSQDMVFLKTGDTLYGRIISMDQEKIIFQSNYEGKKIQSAIPKEMAIGFRLNSGNKEQVNRKPDSTDKLIPVVRFAVSGGWSYRTAPLSADVPEVFVKYAKDLMEGKNLAFDLAFFFRNNLGFGLKFNTYYSSNYMDNITKIYPNGQRVTGRVENNVQISYFGPSFCDRYQFNSKNATALLVISAGLLNYNEMAFMVDERYEIKGLSAGAGGSAGIDFYLSKNFAIGLEMGVVLGSFRKFTVNGNDFTMSPAENVSRVDFSVGIRFQ